MSKVDTIEKRLEGLEELLTLAIRLGEFHISRMIRENIEGAERELRIERNIKTKGNDSNTTNN
jgi:hypothetical protein